MIGLLHGCRSAGVQLERGHRVERLLCDDSGVPGVKVARASGTVRVTARAGVVLASGGFESDSSMALRLQGEPRAVPISPPVNRGDGLRLAGSVGAQIVGASEGWFLPVLRLPGEPGPTAGCGRAWPTPSAGGRT